jgi:hypothetical protein
MFKKIAPKKQTNQQVQKIIAHCLVLLKSERYKKTIQHLKQASPHNKKKIPPLSKKQSRIQGTLCYAASD